MGISSGSRAVILYFFYFIIFFHKNGRELAEYFGGIGLLLWNWLPKYSKKKSSSVLQELRKSKWPIVTSGVPSLTLSPPSLFFLPSPMGHCRKWLLSYSPSSRYRVIKTSCTISHGGVPHPVRLVGQSWSSINTDIHRPRTHMGRMDGNN